MLDGRALIKKATADMNEAKLLNFNIEIDTEIDYAEGEKLTDIVNYFLDSIETVPETKENLIPSSAIHAYNSIIDKAVSFDIADTSDDEFDLESIVFRRTKFNE